MTDDKQLRPAGPGDPNPFHYFHMDKAPSDTKLEMAIHQGYVPATCLLAGIVVLDEVNKGRNPCWGCEGPRERCRGKPRRTGFLGTFRPSQQGGTVPPDPKLKKLWDLATLAAGGADVKEVDAAIVEALKAGPVYGVLGVDERIKLPEGESVVTGHAGHVLAHPGDRTGHVITAPGDLGWVAVEVGDEVVDNGDGTVTVTRRKRPRGAVRGSDWRTFTFRPFQKGDAVADADAFQPDPDKELLQEALAAVKARIKPLIGFPVGDTLFAAIDKAIRPTLERIAKQRVSPITVVCDASNNTEDDAARGVLNVRMRFDPERATPREIEMWERLTRSDP